MKHQVEPAEPERKSAGRHIEISAWWHEYVRVETDRFLLLVLIVVLLWHDPGGDLKMVLGALIMAIQNNRYPRQPSPQSKG